MIPNRKDYRHVLRSRTQAFARGTPQAPSAGGYGGAEAVIAAYGAIGVRRTELTAAHMRAAQQGYLIPANPYLTQPGHWGFLVPAGTSNATLILPPGGGSVFTPPPGAAFNAIMPFNIAGTSMLPTASALNAPAPKPLPVEIKAGELMAWRCWRIDKGEILSVFMGSKWEEGATIAAHLKPSANGHGVHAWKTEAQARDYAKTIPYNRDCPCDEVAIGTVELWGEVIEHEQGYRAQFGQIKEIVERVPVSQCATILPQLRDVFTKDPWYREGALLATLSLLVGLIVMGMFRFLGAPLFGYIFATILGGMSAFVCVTMLYAYKRGI